MGINSYRNLIPRQKRTILLFAIAQTITWAGLFYVFPALLISWENDLGWSRVDITGALTLAIILQGLCSPLCGKLIDLGKGPLVMTCCILLGSAGLFTLSKIDSIIGFYAIWAVIGISFSGCLYDPCFALVTRSLGNAAKQSIMLITIVAGLAGTVSFPSAYFLSDAVGWRDTVQIFALTVAIIAAPITWTITSRLERNRCLERPQASIEKRNSKRFVNPVFLCLGIGFSFAAVVHGATLHHFLPLLKERNIAAETAVFAASLIGPMQVVGRLILSFFQHRITNHVIAMSCFIIMGSSMVLLMGITSTPELVFLFVIIFGSGYGLVSIIRPVISRDILGNANFGMNYGMIALIYMMGSAISPFFGSLIWKFGGYDLLLRCLMALALIGIALYLVAYSLAPRLGSLNRHA